MVAAAVAAGMAEVAEMVVEIALALAVVRMVEDAPVPVPALAAPSVPRTCCALASKCLADDGNHSDHSAVSA